MVNATGKRFVDEGADFRNYTYAKYGRVMLEQPGQFAWQIFDQKVKHLQRDEYRIRQITKVDGQHDRGTRAEARRRRTRSSSSRPSPSTTRRCARTFRSIPTSRTAARTEGLAINKSNWANTIDQPPYEGYAVTCGITFTFGGLRINTDGEVLNTDYQPIRGLYAAGELVGGLFYFNYPGRLGPHLGRGVRQDRRHLGGARGEELSVISVNASMPSYDARDRHASAQHAHGDEMSAPSPRRDTTCEAVVRDCLERIDAREPPFTPGPAFDPELALRQARALDRGPGARPAARRSDRRQGHHRHRRSCRPRWARRSIAATGPPADAACVALLRAAGAVILGKTVTCEFAGMTPGTTTNPHDPAHTPGGSSSGSGAAVADFMVPAALGTQTGGSVLRPASYCGVFGYKPTFGAFNRAGVKSGGRKPRHASA